VEVGAGVGLGGSGVTVGRRARVGKGEIVGGRALSIYSQPFRSSTARNRSKSRSGSRNNLLPPDLAEKRKRNHTNNEKDNVCFLFLCISGE
jgi:hypothetical protein